MNFWVYGTDKLHIETNILKVWDILKPKYWILHSGENTTNTICLTGKLRVKQNIIKHKKEYDQFHRCTLMELLTIITSQE